MTRCVFHRWRNRASEKSNVCTEVCCLIRQESCIPEPDLRELTTHSPPTPPSFLKRTVAPSSLPLSLPLDCEFEEKPVYSFTVWPAECQVLKASAERAPQVQPRDT